MRPTPDDVGAEPARERRRAWDEATAAVTRRATAGGSACAVRAYGHASAVLALGGAFDRLGRDRLDGCVAELETAGTRDLTVDLGGLTACDDRLARALAHLRVRVLVAGMSVRWCRVPPRLADELRHGVPEAFTVDDGP